MDKVYKCKSELSFEDNIMEALIFTHTKNGEIEDLYEEIEDECLEDLDSKLGYFLSYQTSDVLIECEGNFRYDDENIAGEYEGYQYCSARSNHSSLHGMNKLEGIEFLGYDSGGDWENPSYKILYVYGEHFYLYTPKDGNIYNAFNNSAFGNDHELDDKYCIEKYGFSYENMGNDRLIPFKLDFSLIENDITNHFKSLK